MDATELVGTWRLVQWRALKDHRDGTTDATEPMGPNPHGVLHYGPDGRMSVLISAADRTDFSGDDFLGGTVQERADAFEGFIAYAGTFALSGDEVTHTVEIASYPNWVGTEQRRLVSWRDGRLVLSTEPIRTDGQARRSELIWSRVAPLASV